MLPQTPSEEFEAELNRVVTRLRSMPLDKIQATTEVFLKLSEELLNCSTALNDASPVPLPEIEARAYGDVIAVLAADVKHACTDETQLIPATLALTTARRALP